MSPSVSTTPEAFVSWLRVQEDEGLLYLSAVTIHEIAKGIALLDHKGATAKAAKIRQWLDLLILDFDDRILPFDTTVASVAGQLEALADSAGHKPGMADATIAGTAHIHHLTIVTSNIRHFAAFGVDVLTPESLTR